MKRFVRQTGAHSMRDTVRYVGDRLLLIPLPPWADYHMDPISIRDVLHYLVAAGDADRVTAGAYDVVGPGTTTYRGLLGTYIRATGALRAALPLSDWHCQVNWWTYRPRVVRRLWWKALSQFTFRRRSCSPR
jgi:uncharacterized protein YbjT (DUF2867 family)